MLAVFGIPGGYEWLVIVGIVLLAFGPTAIVAWLAYQLGVSRGHERAECDGGEPTKAAAPKELTTARGETPADAKDSDV